MSCPVEVRSIAPSGILELILYASQVIGPGVCKAFGDSSEAEGPWPESNLQGFPLNLT